jgi:hypothetical protein
MDLELSTRKELAAPPQTGLTMTETPEPPELEPDPVPGQFFSWRAALQNLPFIAALALAIFGVAYSNFSGHPITGYWEFLAIAMALACVATGWPSAPERDARFRLIWTEAAHWIAVLVGMNLVLLQGFQQLLPVQASGLVLLLLLAIGTFLAGVHLPSLRIAFLGLAMAMSIPAMTWLKQASLLLLLGAVAIAGLAIAFWPRGRRESA